MVEIGEIGMDGSHRFRVNDIRGNEIQIEYTQEPTATLWVQENRISYRENNLENELVLQ
jgi:hypothetical protein